MHFSPVFDAFLLIIEAFSSLFNHLCAVFEVKNSFKKFL
jgi:hypothetical protein